MNNALPEKVIEAIKNRGILPRPRWQFLLKRFTLWSLAAATTVLGGVAVAVIVFIFIDHDANVRAHLNESVFVDLFKTIPYLWLGALLLLTLVAQYVVRHTKFGYRHTPIQIVGVVITCSIALGTLLSALEVGERVQDFLVARTPYYDALVSTSKDVWSRPEKGLLGGTIAEVRSAEEVTLVDFQGKSWLVDIGEIDVVNNSPIQSGIIVKMMGSQEDMSGFRAVQILPWK